MRDRRAELPFAEFITLTALMISLVALSIDAMLPALPAIGISRTANIHEDDIAQAVELSIRPGLRGIFNLVGPGSLPLSVLCRQTGANRIPLPEPLAKIAVDQAYRMNKFPFPSSGLRKSAPG